MGEKGTAKENHPHNSLNMEMFIWFLHGAFTACASSFGVGRYPAGYWKRNVDNNPATTL